MSACVEPHAWQPGGPLVGVTPWGGRSALPEQLPPCASVHRMSSAVSTGAPAVGCGVSFLRALLRPRETDVRAALLWISGSLESGAVWPSEPPARVSPVQADIPTGPGWHQPNRDNMPGFSAAFIPCLAVSFIPR